MKLTKDSRTNIVSHCQFLIVFCTKYKKEVLTEHIKNRLKQIFEEEIDTMDKVQLRFLDIHPDHITLKLQCDDIQMGVHKVIKKLKAQSSSILRDEFKLLRSTLPSLWNSEYYIATYGSDDLNTEIIEFIKNQKERRE